MLEGVVLLEDVVQALPGTVFLLDVERRLRWMNAAAAGMVRHLYDRDVAPGTLFDELSSPDTLEDFRRNFARACEGQALIIRRDIRYPSGAMRVWEVTYLPVREAGGVVTGVLFCGRDVESGESARERMRLFERALCSVNVGVTLVDARDPEQPLVFMNPAFERITGYGYAESIGRNCRFLQGEDRDQPGLMHLRAALKEARTERVVLRNYRKDGTLFWNSLTLSPVRDDSGQLTHFVGVQQDITDTYEAQARLSRAVRMEAAGQLAAGIAHDVNNLLTVMQMNSCMLAQSVDPVAKEIAGDVELLATRAHAVIRRLLNFARGETSEPVDLELGDFLMRVDHLVRPLLGRDIELVVLAPHEPLAVHVDGTALEQVLVNLVVNARHAMPNGGVLRISVEPRLDGQGRAWAVIAVADTGCGMSPQVKLRLFEPFFTTRAESGGTGLGLATSRRFLREAGGDLEVESELGHGTTFRLVLPAVPMLPKAGPAGAALLGPPGRGETLLLADDEVTVRRWMARALTRHGYRIIEASDGAEALELVARERPQLVICDAIMPRVGARGVLGALAQQPSPPPVIVASGYGPGVLDGVAERPAALLNKSFTLAELTHCVRAVLDRKAWKGPPAGA